MKKNEDVNAPVQEENTPYVIETDPQYNIPTEELLKLFPVTYQTPALTKMEQNVQNRMLNGFNRWNMGYAAWSSRAEEFYTEDAVCTYKDKELTVSQLKEVMKPIIASTRRVRINNILVSENWTAVHYWDVTTLEDGTEDVANHMQFLRFAEDGDGVKVDLCWAC